MNKLHVAVLEDQADPPAEFKIESIFQKGLFSQWAPECQNRTLAGKVQPIQDFEQRALPAAVRTQDGQPFPRPTVRLT